MLPAPFRGRTRSQAEVFLGTALRAEFLVVRLRFVEYLDGDYECGGDACPLLVRELFAPAHRIDVIHDASDLDLDSRLEVPAVVGRIEDRGEHDHILDDSLPLGVPEIVLGNVGPGVLDGEGHRAVDFILPSILRRAAVEESRKTDDGRTHPLA